MKLISVLCVTLAVGACERQPDPTEAANQALEQSNIAGAKVEWDGEARIAHLRGTVESTTDRTRAEDVVESAVGTTGRVLNELTVRGLNEDTADDLDGRIRSAIDDMIDRDASLADRDIDVEVTNGVVTVKGEVQSLAEKARITEIIGAAPGVKDMANAVEVKSQSQQ